MTPGDSRQRNGVDQPSLDTGADWTDATEPKTPNAHQEPLLNGGEPADADCRSTTGYVPTIEEIKGELWSIATGEGSESSRVSALRVLADIMGLMKQAPSEFPAGMSALMDALAEGLSTRN